MNKKPTILAVAALGSLALIGTGFAGWVIVANATSTASGNITAYTVADRRLIVSEAKWGTEKTGSSGSIIFGKPATQSNPSAWFFGEGMETEKLEDSFVVNVHSGDSSDQSTATVSAEIAVNDPNNAAWKEAIKEHYITAPTITFNGAPGAASSETATGSLTLKGMTEVEASFTVKFSWGEYFTVGNKIKNPYEFFNTKIEAEKVPGSESETWGTKAKNVMTVIAGLNELKFTATVTFTHASNAAA